jgi:hypothetical protein
VFIRVLLCGALGFGAWYFLAGERRVEKFKEFSPDGNFKVLMPGIPKERFVPDKKLRIRSWTATAQVLQYGVVAIDIPPESVLWFQLFPETLLNKLCNVVLQDESLIVIRNEKTMLAGKYPGRDIEVEGRLRDEILLARAYIAKKRIYLVGATASRAWMSKDEARKFLDSFELIGDQ